MLLKQVLQLLDAAIEKDAEDEDQN